tara:strand:+ start:24 stop:266 length:243 start_codon:yes stop_codon:yes gene_type:complete
MKIDITHIHNNYNDWSGETVSLIHNDKPISGKVIKTEQYLYHIIVTTDNKVVSVDWDEQFDEMNNYIFNDYDFTTKLNNK